MNDLETRLSQRLRDHAAIARPDDRLDNVFDGTRTYVVTRTARSHRGPVLVGALAIGAVAAGGIVLASRPGDRPGPGAATAPTTATTVVDTTAITTPAPIASGRDAFFSGEPANLTWSKFVPGSSIADSQVTSMAAGPGGYVATGLRFGVGPDQGGVWFSTDGGNWEEVDTDLFGPQDVGTVTATSQAFYLVASVTPDSEGSPSNPARIYSSSDGRSWQPVGDAQPTETWIVAVRDVLVRGGSSPGLLETSSDGVAWSPATFAGARPGADERFDNVLTKGRHSYLRSTSSRGLDVWMTDGGMVWQRLPQPPVGGYLAETDRGLALLATVAASGNSCDGVAPGMSATTVRDVLSQWGCLTAGEIYYLADGADTWTDIGTGPGPSPAVSPIWAIGHQFVAPVLGSDGSASFVASVDGHTWTEATPLTVAGRVDERVGSPQPFFVGLVTEQVVIIPIRIPGSHQTVFVVGRV